MKIVQINCVYNIGSTGKIVKDLHYGLLEKNLNSFVIYGRGNKIYDDKIYKLGHEGIAKFNNVISRFTGNIYGGCYFSTKKIINEIKKINPDVVHLQCINGYFVNIYKLLDFLKKNKYKTVLTLHAEFMYTGNCGYSLDCKQWINGCKKCLNKRSAINSIFIDKTSLNWKRMKTSFTGFDNLTVVSVSPWLMNRAKQSSILGDFKNITILNGINTKNFFHFHNAQCMREKLGFAKSDKIIIHVNSLFNNPIKGGKYVIDIAKKLNENIKIILVGVDKITEQLPKNIILMGKVSDQEYLGKLYSMADLTLLTSMRETFSMVVAESLCSGTPVVGFECGGAESIAISEYSSFVKYGDMEAILKKINFHLNKRYDKKLISNISIKKYSKDIMLENYMREYLK